jgi:hypothetical protein
VAQWLAPEAAKPNGRDHDPPPIAPMGNPAESSGFSSRRSPTPHAGKARRGKAELGGIHAFKKD